MRIPRSVWNQFILSPEELFDEVMDSVDLCTDDLARSAFPEAEIVRADVSRIVVDVERFADDSKETMSSVGRRMTNHKSLKFGRSTHPVRLVRAANQGH